MGAKRGVLARLYFSFRSAFVALLGLAALSCGGMPELPSRGGPRWLSLTSAHFVLLTDAPDARAREQSLALERQLHALCELGFSCRVQLPLQLRVIALSDRAHFERVFGPEHAGVASPELLFEPLVVLSGGTASESLLTLNRVLALYLAGQAMGPLPPWLELGLAAYFESASYDPDGAFVVGAVPRRHALWLHAHPRVPAMQLLDPTVQSADPESLAPSAWLLVHYLMSERGSDFAAFQAAVSSGKDLAASFHEAFADLAPDRLDALLDRYAQTGSYLSLSRRIAAPPSEPQIAALSDADVLELRAELGAICTTCKADDARAVNDDLQRALAIEPKHLRANVLWAQRASSPGAAQLTGAEQLAREHPDAALAHLHLARLRDRAQSPQRCAPELLAKLESLASANAYALALRARCEQAQGHSDNALQLSRRALALAPQDPRHVLAHAELLYAQRACAELALLLERTRGHQNDQGSATRLAQLARCEAPDRTDQPQKTTAQEP